jgi:hypothetical protein
LPAALAWGTSTVPRATAAARDAIAIARRAPTALGRCARTRGLLDRKASTPHGNTLATRCFPLLIALKTAGQLLGGPGPAETENVDPKPEALKRPQGSASTGPWVGEQQSLRQARELPHSRALNAVALSAVAQFRVRRCYEQPVFVPQSLHV